MDNNRIPKQGEIYRHFKDRLYQIITVATHSESGEQMVVYQALYGDFKSYVRPLAMFLSEVDKEKYPQVKQQYRFELVRTQDGQFTTENENAQNPAPNMKSEVIEDTNIKKKEVQTVENTPTENRSILVENNTENAPAVNSILLQFLDAKSYNKKLEVLTSNMKHLNDRLINDMAVSLDCTVEEGPLDQRIQGLIHCLQAMRRFEDRRLR